MSNLLCSLLPHLLADQSQPTAGDLLDPVLLLWLAASAALAFGIAHRFGPLKRARRRVGAGDSRSLLLLILGAGLFAYLAAQAFYVQARGFSKSAEIPERDMVVIGLLSDGAMAATMLIMTAALRRDGLDRIGLTRRNAAAAVFKAPVLLAMLYPFIVWIGVVSALVWAHYHTGAPPEHDMIRILKQNPSRSIAWLIDIAAVLAAPVAEELFFRGYLQTLIRELPTPPWIAIVLASLAFTLVHNPPVIWPMIFALALGLGYLYERTGNLALTMLMHAAFNGLQIFLVGHGSN